MKTRSISSVVVFLVCFAVYLLGLAPDLYWLDSSELAAGAFTLGIAHPPGQPLAMLVGKLFCFLPFGSVALRVGLASAVAGAAAAAQTARLGSFIARRLGYPSELLGVAAGLCFGLSYAGAFQSVRPEVYALSALCVITAALELLRYDESGDRRRLYLAALSIGLGLANHHLLTLMVAVPGLLFAVIRNHTKKSAEVVARVAVAGALGLSLYAYLPLRAIHHPLLDWGAPTSWSRVFWVVSARAFQKTVAKADVGDAAGVLQALTMQLHLVGALLALAGLYLLIRLRETRRIGLFLFGAIAFNTAAPALVTFDEGNPDKYGYLEVAVALSAACACALPALLASHMRRLAHVLPALLVAGSLAWGAFQWPRVTLSQFHDAGRVTGEWLERAPPGGRAITSYFQTLFALWYLRAVEERRPDVSVIHRHFLSYPGYRDDLISREPVLAPLLGDHDVRDAEGLVEYDFDLPDAWVARSSLPEMGAADFEEPQTRRFAGWMAFLAAHRACRLNENASIMIDRARTLIGDAPELSGGCDKLRSSFDR